MALLRHSSLPEYDPAQHGPNRFAFIVEHAPKARALRAYELDMHRIARWTAERAATDAQAATHPSLPAA